MSDLPTKRDKKKEKSLSLVESCEHTSPTVRPCPHSTLIVDLESRTIRCETCGDEIDVFDMISSLINTATVDTMRFPQSQGVRVFPSEHTEADRAAGVLHGVWQSADTVPCCPNCGTGLLPEDINQDTITTTTRELESKRRQFEQG